MMPPADLTFEADPTSQHPSAMRASLPLSRRLGRWLAPLRLGAVQAPRRALLSYLTAPFCAGLGWRTPVVRHSNRIECREMLAALHALGYAVDVIDHDCRRALDFARYELVLGFGHPFAESFFCPRFRGLRLMYCTGANPAYSMPAEAERARYFRERHGFFPRPRKNVDVPWSFPMVNADALLIIGNEWTLSTYRAFNPRLHALPAPTIRQYRCGDADADAADAIDTACADAPVAHATADSRPIERFLWFGGNGAVHKGLDLLIDALATLERPVQLSVCGRIAGERDVLQYYRARDFGALQIRWHDFIAVDSPAFTQLAREHDFVVLPSCSEGSATSLLNCMAEGVIPVMTRECGIEPLDFGIPIGAASVAGVRAALLQACAVPAEERRQRRQRAAQRARLAHSPAAFRDSLRSSLQQVLATADS